MSNIAIKAVNLGKVYKIRPDRGEVESRTLQEDIIDIFNPKKKQAKESLWALKDVSFEVNDGEVVGLIGRNGAGKSTLLKILARITEPTTGYVDLYGRTGSLLEVGTGFHSELNGRENIYLGGAVLGMTKKEIDRKFDEIVDFSGVEKFLNTPVKRYSSGMKVRLAFSVAAHLEPEILLVDEVLSVGDAEFRKKSLGKMNDVAKGGRTVVFVSHNMGAISGLCSRVMLLDKGMVIGNTTPEAAIEKYMSLVINSEGDHESLRMRRDRTGSGEALFTDFWIEVSGKKVQHSQIPLSAKKKEFCLEIESKKIMDPLGIAIGVYDITNNCPIWLDSRAYHDNVQLKSGTNTISVLLPEDFALVQGYYRVNIALFGIDGFIDYVANAFEFNMIDGDFYGTGKTSGGNPAIYTKQVWQINENQ